MSCFEKICYFCLIALIAIAVCARPLDLSKSRAHDKFHRQLRKSLSQSKYFGDILFVPAPLPCQYILNRTWVVDDFDNEMFYEYDIYSVHGTLYKSVIDIPAEEHDELIFRPDVKIRDPNSDKIYVARYDCSDMFYPPCDNVMFEAQAGADWIKEDLDWFYGNWTFTKQSQGEFQGVKCQVYYRYEARSQADVYLYATDDNLIIGFSAFTPDLNETIYVNYEYIAKQDIFVLDKSIFSVDDINDTRAFIPPTYEPCK